MKKLLQKNLDKLNTYISGGSKEKIDGTENNIESPIYDAVVIGAGICVVSCGDNHLTQLPISIIYCTNLEAIDYDNNPVDNLPIVIRWLNNRQDRPSTQMQIYTDTQSVHNHAIQQSIQQCVVALLSDCSDTGINIATTITTVNQIINDNILSENIKNALVEYAGDPTVHSVSQATFQEVLTGVWGRIVRHESKDEIKKVLNGEMSDALCKCFTGRISRLINCLSGFYDDIQVKIADSDQIGNIILIVKDRLMKEGRYSVKLHQETVAQNLTERGYDRLIISEWIAFIE